MSVSSDFSETKDYSPGRDVDSYEALVDAQSELGEGVCVVRGHSRKILYANGAVCKILQYSEGELLAFKSVFDLVAPENLEEVRVRAALRASNAVVLDHYDLHLFRKDGKKLLVEMAVKPVEGVEGVFVVLLREKTGETAVHDPNLGTMYVILDNTGHVMFTGLAFVVRLGWKWEDVIGKKFTEFYADGGDAEFANVVQSAMMREPQAIHVKTSDGGKISVTLSASPLISANAKVGLALLLRYNP